jgi:UDP-N-acetylglucosamine 2-epimerase (non-hydrolysing)
MQHAPISIATVFGTRPEAVKLAPVIRLLARDERFLLRVFVTGQHREMMREILDPFGVHPDVDLEIMQPGQTLNDIVCRAMPRLDELYGRERPDMVLVQGDTTSAFCAALAAFDRHIPVGHVEAGLRSFDCLNPYPEESNRRMLSAVAELHFAPTPWAKKNLLREGVRKASITVTGNTVVDALLLTLRARASRCCDASSPASERRSVLVTLHRREAWETPGQDGASVLDDILLGIRLAAEKRADVDFVYPVHLNPNVQKAARRVLGNTPNAKLVAPLPYVRFVESMARSSAIVTDSGGVQEEAPSLGIPVLVVRKTTERPEAVETGANHLVGTHPGDIERALCGVLDQYEDGRNPGRTPEGVGHLIPFPNPFGDGNAAPRIVQAVLHFWGRGDAPGEFLATETGSKSIEATS